MTSAVQGKKTLTAEIMRGALRRLQDYNLTSKASFETSCHNNGSDEVLNNQWAARLWEWASCNGLRLYFEGISTAITEVKLSLVDIAYGQCTKSVIRQGCHKYNVNTKFNLLQSDGYTLQYLPCGRMENGPVMNLSGLQQSETALGGHHHPQQQHLL